MATAITPDKYEENMLSQELNSGLPKAPSIAPNLKGTEWLTSTTPPIDFTGDTTGRREVYLENKHNMEKWMGKARAQLGGGGMASPDQIVDATVRNNPYVDAGTAAAAQGHVKEMISQNPTAKAKYEEEQRMADLAANMNYTPEQLAVRSRLPPNMREIFDTLTGNEALSKVFPSIGPTNEAAAGLPQASPSRKPGEITTPTGAWATSPEQVAFEMQRSAEQDRQIKRDSDAKAITGLIRNGTITQQAGAAMIDKLYTEEQKVDFQPRVVTVDGQRLVELSKGQFAKATDVKEKRPDGEYPHPKGVEFIQNGESTVLDLTFWGYNGERWLPRKDAASPDLIDGSTAVNYSPEQAQGGNKARPAVQVPPEVAPRIRAARALPNLTELELNELKWIEANWKTPEAKEIFERAYSKRLKGGN